MDSNEEEIDDLSTCTVCFIEYDDVKKKPKFLQCFHTLCMECLEAIRKNECIVCPLCRLPSPCSNGAAHLRNNPHATKLVALRNEMNMKSQRSKVWCVTCASPAGTRCAFNHQTVEIPLKEPTGGQELQSTIDDYHWKLSQVLEKRRSLHCQFQEILSGLKAFEEAIKCQNEDNERKMAELLSVLDTAKTKSTPAETYQLMKSRIIKSVAERDHEMKILSEKLCDLETEKNIRLRIQLETWGKCNAQRFVRDDPMEGEAAAAPDPQCTFVLQVNDQTNLIGEIHVEPNPTFDRAFINRLFHFCQRPKVFNSRVVTRDSESFLLLDFDNEEFRPSAPVLPQERAESSLDVGMIPMLDDDLCWQLMFYLKDTDSKSLGPFPLFGKVVDGSHVIAALSRIKTVGKRSCLSVTWRVI